MNIWMILVLVGFIIALVPMPIAFLFGVGNRVITGTFGLGRRQLAALEGLAIGCAVLGFGAVLAGVIGLMTTMHWGLR